MIPHFFIHHGSVVLLMGSFTDGPNPGRGNFPAGGTSADGPGSAVFACALMGTLLLTLLMIGAGIWGIRRHQRRFGWELELMEELVEREVADEPDPPPPISRPSPSAAPAWQKPADWWRHSDGMHPSGQGFRGKKDSD